MNDQKLPIEYSEELGVVLAKALTAFRGGMSRQTLNIHTILAQTPSDAAGYLGAFLAEVLPKTGRIWESEGRRLAREWVSQVMRET